MPTPDPTQLVEEFKNSGQFDRLRREALAEFKNSDGIGKFKARVDDAVQKHLQSDQGQRLKYNMAMALVADEAAFHRELMQEVERYPIVERAVEDITMLKDESFAENIRAGVKMTLEEMRGGNPQRSIPSTGEEIVLGPTREPNEQSHSSPTFMDTLEHDGHANKQN